MNDKITPYPEQQRAIDHHLAVLSKHQATLDGSDTGVGKTIIGLGVARARQAPYLVVTPKNAVTSWLRTAERMDTQPLGVLNIEKLKTGKTPWVKKLAKRKFEWTLPEGAMVIFDEAHRCGGVDTQNAYLLGALKVTGNPVMLLSATLADSPIRLRATGFLLGLHNFVGFPEWAALHGVYRNPWRKLEFTKSPSRQQAVMTKLHAALYPEHGHRLTIADMPSFPECATFASAYDLGSYTKQVNQIYADMNAELRKTDHANPLTAQLRARQAAELLKVPLLLDLAEEYAVEEKKSVVIFACFIDTIRALRAAMELRTEPEFTEPSIIIGGQKSEVRTQEQDRFLANESRICLCSIGAGGIAIDLDDKQGTHPRISLITPPFSAVELKQALGRIHRASSKTKAIQYILFAAGTVEERACRSVQRKLDNLSLLNDGDLQDGIVEITK